MPHKTLEEVACEYIRKGIVTHRFKPGDRLSEPSIAQEIGCSRTPVRAALRRLSTEGLVVISRNHQAEVIIPSVKDIDDAFQMRELQESLSARLACARATSKDVEYLWELEMAMREDYRRRDLYAFLRNNDAFHFYIAELADNSFLEHSVRSVVTLTNIYISLLDPFYEWQEEEVPSFNEHQILLSAFDDNDVIRAEYAMRVHVLSTRSDIDMARLEEAQLHRPEE